MDESVNVGLALGIVAMAGLPIVSTRVFSFSIGETRSACAMVSDWGSILTLGSEFLVGSDKELETSGGVRTAETKELAGVKPGSLCRIPIPPM